MPKKTTSLVPAERIERAILLIRGQKVMLDADLAALYGVSTKQLLQSVKRNRERFPDDFAFVLTGKEFAILRSQIVTSSSSWGGRRTAPWVFTQEGIAMLSSVLRSERAIQVNIEIMRAFVRLREIMANHADLARRLDELERCFREHDEQFALVFDAIRKLMEPPRTEPAELGYHTLIEHK
jgi:ORF6N domain